LWLPVSSQIYWPLFKLADKLQYERYD
jgi:hypothetical protein